MAATPFPSQWAPTPTATSAWNNMTPENKQIYGLLAQQSNDGMIRNLNANAQHAMANRRTPSQPNTQPQKGPALGTAPAAKSSNTNVSYKSGINVGPAIGKSNVLGGLLETGNSSNPNVSTFGRAVALNDYAQLGRGIDSANLDQHMQQQARRSESMQEGLGNLAKIAGDMSERSISQTGLAAQVAANNIGFGAGVTAAMNPVAGLNLANRLRSGGVRL